jgi:hypothetical protein
VRYSLAGFQCSTRHRARRTCTVQPITADDIIACLPAAIRSLR